MLEYEEGSSSPWFYLLFSSGSCLHFLSENVRSKKKDQKYHEEESKDRRNTDYTEGPFCRMKCNFEVLQLLTLIPGKFDHDIYEKPMEIKNGGHRRKKFPDLKSVKERQKDQMFMRY